MHLMCASSLGVPFHPDRGSQKTWKNRRIFFPWSPVKSARFPGQWKFFRKAGHWIVKKKQGANCEYCVNYSYDDDYECYTCEMNLDEDEMYRFITGTYHDCPYFRMGDEYRVVRKQM